MNSKKIAIIGLGYVGLPLAVEFGKKRPVIGFDINQSRIDNLKNGIDTTLETTRQDLKDAIYLALKSIESGTALSKLEDLVKESNE